MPQESFRSAVYRSFVTCDGPKGVIERKTIRKSKNRSNKSEEKVENGRMKKNFNTNHREKSDPSSSCQLMEVSREAHKLNRVIDSWSRGSNINEKSKDIAKDLLRGALDLQQSLIMLQNLQEEASIFRTKSTRKKDDEFQNRETGFQKPRVSADGSSRDCYEELRNVIRESFERQNLLPNHSSSSSSYVEERKKKSVFSPDFAPTSSCQSSIFHSSDCSSFSSNEKPKGPNLIAKLMGLEEIPSKPLDQDKFCLNRTRPMFEIDVPKARKPQKIDNYKERKTLEEIIETMQFKGLLKKNKKQNSCLEPIVIIKPLQIPYLEEEEEEEELQTQSKTTFQVQRKLKPEKNPIEKVKFVAENEDKEAEIKEKWCSNRTRGSVSLNPLFRKEEIEKKVDWIQKVALPPKRRNEMGTDKVKSRNVPKSQDNISKNQSLKQKSKDLNPISAGTKSSMSSVQKKKNVKSEKPVSEPLPNANVEKIEQKEEIPLVTDNASADASEILIEENSDKHQNSLCQPNVTSNQKDILLSSPFFLSRVEELFHIKSYQRQMGFQTAFLGKSETADSRLLLDFADELLEHKSLERKMPVSIGGLVEEVCDLFENMGRCNKMMVVGIDEGFGVDLLFPVLERDLYVGGGWDIGWRRKGFPEEEVVMGVEEVILSWLVEEVVEDCFWAKSGGGAY